MNSLNKIMNMLNWNNNPQTQKKGIALANQIKDLNVFLQPMDFGSKAVWDNCAKILVGKTDNDLAPYLDKLLEWLQDLNWPGALLILERLKNFSGEKLKKPFLELVNNAIKMNNEEGLMWLDYLSELLDNKELRAILPEETLQVLEKHYHNWAWWYKE